MTSNIYDQPFLHLNFTTYLFYSYYLSVYIKIISKDRKFSKFPCLTIPRMSSNFITSNIPWTPRFPPKINYKFRYIFTIDSFKNTTKFSKYSYLNILFSKYSAILQHQTSTKLFDHNFHLSSRNPTLVQNYFAINSREFTSTTCCRP